MNYFKVVKAQLELGSPQMRQPAVNPSIEENQVLVNAVLEKYRVVIDADQCQSLIFDMQFATMLPDGTLKKTDREDPTQQLDALDCLRYYLNTFFKHFLKQHKHAA
jgi:hypothetical protein